ncbi:helix-turn-helix transcriptional regulator [Sphingopyxis sp. J-6]|uniref:helix-turn-helix domain-containing protein n=1 Tax=Sphingopyxis sp. J-6 TaxID=3122054 RepID=UPI003983E80A
MTRRTTPADRDRLDASDVLTAMPDKRLLEKAGMAVSAFLENSSTGAGRRRSTRRALRLTASGLSGSGDACPILIHDISAEGLLIECDLPLAPDESIDVELPHAGRCLAKIVWASGRLFGCRFDAPVSRATLSAAALRSAVEHPVERPRQAQTIGDEMLGARIQRLRSLKGLTQSQLAERAGVSEAAVCNWEKGKARPRPYRTEILADILGVSKVELLTNEPGANMADIVEQARAWIATAMDIAPDRIRIAIEF